MMPMKISDIARLLDTDVMCGEEYMDVEIRTACGSDPVSYTHLKYLRRLTSTDTDGTIIK